MIAPLATLLQRLGRHAWLHKSVRTLLVVAPGLGVFVGTGEPRGVLFAFAALCLSVPYGDRTFRPVHLAGCAEEPRVLAALTVVVVLFMVAFEQYTLAVAIRSALAPLAAFALHDDAMAAGQARLLCILIGVAIGTTSMLILSNDRLGGVSQRLLKRIGVVQPPGRNEAMRDGEWASPRYRAQTKAPGYAT
jgi:hypothetical protein